MEYKSEVIVDPDDKENFIVKITRDDGKQVRVMIPFEELINNYGAADHPFGLNLVFNGHYQ